MRGEAVSSTDLATTKAAEAVAPLRFETTHLELRGDVGRGEIDATILDMFVVSDGALSRLSEVGLLFAPSNCGVVLHGRCLAEADRAGVSNGAQGPDRCGVGRAVPSLAPSAELFRQAYLLTSGSAGHSRSSTAVGSRPWEQRKRWQAEPCASRMGEKRRDVVTKSPRSWRMNCRWCRTLTYRSRTRRTPR